MSTALVQVEHLRVCFRAPARWPWGTGGKVRVVDEVSLTVAPGEVVALVGESGCGKSTLGRAIARLVDPESGRIWFEGRELTGLGQRELRPLRRRLQIIFQDASSALDPRMSAAAAVREGLAIHRVARGEARREAIATALLERVGIPRAAMSRLPHGLSGGQRQRVGIARALAVEPRFIVADEPFSGLDVSVQAQIANLLSELKEERGLSYLLISHDLRVVSRLADRVAVMYLGRIVEEGPARVICAAPAHPYTRALLAAGDARTGVEAPLEGEPASPISPPAGCTFHPRCPRAVARCRLEAPVLASLGDRHAVACPVAVAEASARGGGEGQEER